jgi:stress response protein YsnF
MLSQQELTEAIGAKAYGPDGDEIGRVEHFFVDDRTGAPTWVAVTTGLFGTRHSIVPALDASFDGGALQVPVDKEAVRTAPSPGDTQHLDPDEEVRLREHYRLDQGGRAPAADEGLREGAAAGTDRTEAPADEAPRRQADDGSMVRSEEQLRVGTETQAATRVRVVRYVVTEEVQVTVPLRREEIRIEEVPLDAPDAADETLEGGPQTGRHTTGGDAGAGAAAGGLPEEIVLHREEPVVGVRVVPTERVRLRTEVVQGTERVSARVQRERITVDEQPVGTAAQQEARGPVTEDRGTQPLGR